jgi:hypothetical protein
MSHRFMPTTLTLTSLKSPVIVPLSSAINFLSSQGGSMKTARKMLTREPEDISGSTNLSRSAQSSVQRERLANKVEKLVEEVFNMYDSSLKKLRELSRSLNEKLQGVPYFLSHYRGSSQSLGTTWEQLLLTVAENHQQRHKKRLNESISSRFCYRFWI